MIYPTAPHAIGKAQTIPGAIVVPASPNGWIVIAPPSRPSNVIALQHRRATRLASVTIRDRVA